MVVLGVISRKGVSWRNVFVDRGQGVVDILLKMWGKALVMGYVGIRKPKSLNKVPSLFRGRLSFGTAAR